MLCLGIESTAHTFGCAVVSFDGKVLSNAKSLYTTATGGMVPIDVARHHNEVKDNILSDALATAGVFFDQISLIAYSAGPGLGPSLLVALEFAKELAKKHSKPIIGVNHCVAHLTIGDLATHVNNPIYLYVSGVNTQIIALAGKRFRIFGETLDIGLGNALDKFGRELGLGFPAGPKIEELAKKGKYHELPYSVKGMDISFAGLVTQAVRLVKGSKLSIEDACFSFQETAFAMLAEVSERALAHCEKDELLLIGGVAANKRLGEMLQKMCAARNARFAAVPIEFAGDQAAMIAWQGILEFKAGRKDDIETADIRPYERTDEVEVFW